MPKRYPLRTVLLMIVALAAFGRLWCLTHPPQTPEETVTTPAEPAQPTEPASPPVPPSGPPSLGAPVPDAPSDAAGSPAGEAAGPGVEGDEASARETSAPQQAPGTDSAPATMKEAN